MFEDKTFNDELHADDYYFPEYKIPEEKKELQNKIFYPSALKSAEQKNFKYIFGGFNETKKVF